MTDSFFLFFLVGLWDVVFLSTFGCLQARPMHIFSRCLFEGRSSSSNELRRPPACFETSKINGKNLNQGKWGESQLAPPCGSYGGYERVNLSG